LILDSCGYALAKSLPQLSRTAAVEDQGLVCGDPPRRVGHPKGEEETPNTSVSLTLTLSRGCSFLYFSLSHSFSCPLSHSRVLSRYNPRSDKHSYSPLAFNLVHMHILSLFRERDSLASLSLCRPLPPSSRVSRCTFLLSLAQLLLTERFRLIKDGHLPQERGKET